MYGLDIGIGISESQSVNPLSPYAKSKYESEKYLKEWANRNNVNLIVLRLPLVVGSNAPGNLGRMIMGIKKGTYLSIGGSVAKKSMVLAEDVACLILSCEGKSGTFNLTDGYHPSFREIESLVCQQLNKPMPRSLTLGFAKLLGKIGDIIPVFPLNTETINKITQDLTFSDSKAREYLGWNPQRVIENWKI